MPRVRMARPRADLQPGDELDVSAAVAARWSADGTATLVEAKALTRPATKAVKGPKETK